MKINLIYQSGRPQLKREDGLIVEADFLNDKVNYHRKKISKKNDLISKACGVSSGCESVLDLTAGLAIDAVQLAQLGYQVTALERNHLLFLLLSESWKMDSNKLNYKLEFLNFDAEEFLSNPDNRKKYDVIYYDPMYPVKDKKALPPKNMQMLQALVGTDEASLNILDLAILSARLRVVVKRPVQAEPIKRPSHSIQSKLVRYDIYLVK